MSNGILVFIEHKSGVANRTSAEAIAAAQALGSQLQQSVSAVVLGADVAGLAQEIAGYDVAKVIAATNPKLADYTPDAYADGMEQVVKQVDPSFVFLTHTYQVRDFAPKLATRFQQVLVSDVVDFRVEGGSVTMVRQLFQGKLNADVKFGANAPYFASFQAGAFRAESAIPARVWDDLINIAIGRAREIADLVPKIDRAKSS